MRSLAKARRTLRPRLALPVSLALLAALVTGCFGSPIGGGGLNNDQRFSLQGTVVDAGPVAAPVAGAIVQAAGHETETGPDGAFSLGNLPVQGPSMPVTVSAPGYETATFLIQPVAGEVLVLDVILAPTGAGEPGDGGTPGDGGDEPGNGGDPGDGGSGGEPEDPVYSGVVEARIRLVNASAGASVSTASAGPADLLTRPVARRPQAATVDASVPGEWIVQLNGDYPVQAVNTTWAAAGVQIVEHLADNFYLVAATGGASDAETEDRLARLPNVVSVEPNRPVHPVAVAYNPNDTYFARQWGLTMVSVPQAWNVTRGSRNVVVAVLDTGLLPNHPDIQGISIVNGRNFASGQSATNYTDDATNLSHGTMVTGIIGAMTNNGSGMAGINWSVSIMPVRVMSSRSGGTVAAVGQGIRWAVDNGAHIINMSLAWDASYNDTFVNQQIEYAASRGVVLVAGAGNDSGRITMPAAHPDVIAVGAVDRNKRVAWYSNYGPQLDVVAPGGDTRSGQAGGILSTDIVSGRLGYSYQQGTSFASPHVAGIAALMYSAGITDAQEIRELLRHTAEDLGTPGFDNYYGYGLVNAYAAVTRSDPVRAQVSVAAEDGRVTGPALPQRMGGQTIARIEGVAPGAQTVFAWIDTVPDGVLGEGDFAGLAAVNVPAEGTVAADLVLALWETLPSNDRARLDALVNR